MSTVRSQEWRIEQERRRKIHLARVRETTREYLERNRERLASLVNQGLDVHVPTEYRHCMELLENVDRYLQSDPESARSFNLQLSASVSTIFNSAHENRLVAEATAREQARLAHAEMREEIQRAFQQLPNATATDLGQADFEGLTRWLDAQPMDIERAGTIRQLLTGHISEVVAKVKARSTEWEAAQEEAKSRRQVVHALEDAIHVHGTLKDGIALTELRNLFGRLNAGLIPASVAARQLTAIEATAAEMAEKELCRRHVVSGLAQQLMAAGFAVSEPTLEGSEVLIRAQRPAGAQAAFRVKLDGIAYKFDRYEGDECLSDVDNIMPKLQEIYGIELGEATVTWQNPPLIGKEARTAPPSSGAQKK